MTLAEDLAACGINDGQISSLLATRIVVTEATSRQVKFPLITEDGTLIFVRLEPSTDPADLEQLAREVPEGGSVVLRPAAIL